MFSNKAHENISSQSFIQEEVVELVNLYNQKNFLAVIKKGETLSKQYPKTLAIWVILGSTLAKTGNLDRSIEAYQRAILLKPDYTECYNNMGVLLKNKDKLDKAIEAFQKALLLKPNYPEAYNNLGNTLKAQGNLDKAIEAFQKAILLKPNYPEAYGNMGNTLKAQGNLDEAIAAFQKAVLLKPNYAQVYINMGATLQNQDKLQDAIEQYEKALSIKPKYAEAYINIAIALHQQGKLKEALEACNKSILLAPDYAEAYDCFGKIQTDLGDLFGAIKNFEQALKLKPELEVARVNKLFNQACICDWNGVEEDKELIPTIGIANQHIVPGMMSTFEDEPARQKIRAEIYAKNTIIQKSIPIPYVLISKPKRLRVGYFSSDFRKHAAMYVMADIFDAHNSDHFEIYGYSFGPDDKSEFRERVINSFDVFRDVREMTYQDIALLARRDKIDIAVDLNGYTRLCRPNIFAYRAAPIQIHFWGSGNTSGANFLDYVIAPELGIPKEQSLHWCEKIIRLPFWCQARYEDDYISDHHVTRKNMGLPENGFVFCSFNSNYKLSPVEFDIWMRLLKQVEGSVLWIYKSNKWVEKNLQKEAFKRGVPINRLVFAEKVPHPKHLSRQKLADVLLDTFNSSAGVTAGDALWAGLPMVTKLGKNFTARTGGYMLKSIQMPELITKTEQEYESLLLDLATNPQRLGAIKEKLRANRLSTPLFNPKLFTKHLENAYQQAYQRYFGGKDPKDILVPKILT